MSIEYFNALISGAHAKSEAPFFELWHADRPSTVVPFKTMAMRTQAAATYFHDRGVTRGSVVLIFGQHSAGLLYAFFGAQLLGAIPSIMPPPTPRQDLEAWRASHIALVERIGPTATVAEPNCYKQVVALGDGPLYTTSDIEAAPENGVPDPRAELDDIAFLQHSSGTTGLKKGVMVTYRQLLSQVTCYRKALCLDPSDAAIVSWLPLYHDMGLIAATLMPFVLGLRTRVIDPIEWLAAPSSFIELLADTPSAYAWLPNFAYAYLAQRGRAPTGGRSLDHVKAIINCSEPCKAPSMEAFSNKYAAFGLRPDAIQVCYAMAEYVFAVTQTSPSAALKYRGFVLSESASTQIATPAELDAPRSKIIVSVGRPIEGVCVRIDGAVVDGELGEVVITGPSLCSGYFRNSSLSEEKFRDGEYLSGDIGFLMKGELFVTGRKDDLLIIRGKNLYAHDIEEVVSSIQGVKPGRVVAIGVENERVGSQELVIAVEKSKDVTPDILSQIITEKVSTIMGVSPVDILVLEENTLIKTTSGKVSRSENAKRYRSGTLSKWQVA